MEVYYFTRTGRSEKIAQDIAATHGINAKKIVDDENWQGAFNFLKGGYMACTKKKTAIEYDKPADKKILLVFPIWAGTFPPAVSAFIDAVGRDSVITVPTSLGSKLKDRDGFIAVCDLIGKNISAENLPHF